MPRPRKVTPHTLSNHDRQVKALDLRRSGANYQQIADWPWQGGKLYNGDRHNARRAIMSLLEETIKEPSEEIKILEVERLDEMLKGLVVKGAFKGNVPAVNAALNIMARRAKLLGLDAPTQIEQTGDGVINVSFTDKLAPSGGMAAPELDVDLPDA